MSYIIASPKKAKLQIVNTFSKDYSLAYFVVHSILIRVRPRVGYISVACCLVTLPKEPFAPGGFFTPEVLLFWATVLHNEL
jgi:hypothetical protein